MSHFTDTLNPAQKEAVLNYDKPSLIVAGAGSGKTRVLTSRIAYMIEQGVHPGSILALTFTNKAAREMRERIEQLVPDGRARYIWMGTFHSVFYRILRQEAGRLGFDANFTIYDTANSESLLSTIIKERNLNTDEYKPRDIHSRISLAKNNLVTAEAYAANTSFVAEDRQRKRPEFSAIFLEYARRCKANNAMDFDDLLIYANILFRDFPDALEQYRNRFRYILVDEYQDTNYAQYLIVRRLAQTHSNVCVVGDDAQSIYSFRGAKIENILRFQNDFPEAKVFKLEQNYRSTQNIVNAANSIIAKNDRQIPKHVFSENDEGDRVKVLKAYTDQEEAYLVADLAKREGRENGGRWNEIAVLYRNNSQSRAIEDALRRRDVPFVLRPQGNQRPRGLFPADSQSARQRSAAPHHQYTGQGHRRGHGGPRGRCRRRARREHVGGAGGNRQRAGTRTEDGGEKTRRLHRPDTLPLARTEHEAAP